MKLLGRIIFWLLAAALFAYLAYQLDPGSAR